MKTYAKISLKLLCLMLICVVALSFCACSQINASTIANDDGSIDELVTITLDEQKFAEVGYGGYQDIQNEILNVAYQAVEGRIKYFNSLTNADIKNQSNKNKLKLTQNTGVWVGNVFKIGLHFDDLDAYKLYYNITEEESNEPLVEKHFFYDKIITKGYTLFASYNSLYRQLVSDFSNYLDQNYPILLNERCQLTYTHVLNYRRQKSDADFVQKIDGKYYHTWILNEGETNKTITIYYTLANRGNCVLVCILISLAVCAVLLLIGFLITKTKKRKTTIDGNKTSI